jgi:hypothetical protein
MPYAKHDGTEVFGITALNVEYYPVPGGVVMHLITDVPGPAVFIPRARLHFELIDGKPANVSLEV